MNTAPKLETLADLESLPIKISYVGEVFKADWGDKGQTVDQWRAELGNSSGFHSFDYFTGTGLRKAPSGLKCPFPRNTTGAQQWAAAHVKPTKPTVADVLHSLILDASAADMNFTEWCNDYGYSDDSISALNTYQACVKAGTILRKYFDRATLERIRELTEDL